MITPVRTQIATGREEEEVGGFIAPQRYGRKAKNYFSTDKRRLRPHIFRCNSYF